MLILIYVSICYAIFKIPVNQWSLATSALGGIIGTALLLLIVNRNHPFTTNARIYFSIPVLHSVRGRVAEVPVQANTPLKEDDALFHARGGGVPAELPAAGEDGRRGLVAFYAVPGHVFKGKVRVVLGGIAAGQSRRRAPS
jgi:hypothetical protein